MSCGGNVSRDLCGLPLTWSGNFADVYRIECPSSGNTWAAKLLHTGSGRTNRDRYRCLASHLEQARLPFMLDFQFREQGIPHRWCVVSGVEDALGGGPTA